MPKPAKAPPGAARSSNRPPLSNRYLGSPVVPFCLVYIRKKGTLMITGLLADLDTHKSWTWSCQRWPVFPVAHPPQRASLDAKSLNRCFRGLIIIKAMTPVAANITVGVGRQRVVERTRVYTGYYHCNRHHYQPATAAAATATAAATTTTKNNSNAQCTGASQRSI